MLHTKYKVTMNSDEAVLSFLSTWFDPQSHTVRRFLLKIYPESNEIEMKDADSGRKFLKRTVLDKNLHRNDFYVGNTINVLSRELKIVDYGDSSTRRLLEISIEKSTILLPMELIYELGKIIHHIESLGLILDQVRSFILSRQMVQETLYSLDAPSLPIDRNEDFVALIAVAFRGTDAVERVRDEMSMWQKYRAILVPKTRELANNYYEMFLGVRHVSTAILEKTNTCCIIKPHAVRALSTGSIIENLITAGYNVRSLASYRLDRSSATEFLNVYRGIIQDFTDLVDEMTSGPLVALELEVSPVEFRKFIGPWDIDMAKALYPESLRARFGTSTIKNAIHSTDLSNHAEFELRYFFELLENVAE